MPFSADRQQESERVSVRGARTHNLKSVNLDIPYRRITSFCGVSGSGKSSLAFDVLYAEGQRRYLECLSPHVRQKLELMDKPEADGIDGILPAIAVAEQTANPRSRATVGVATETSDYLRLLFSKIGIPHCQSCGKQIRRHTPETIVEELRRFPKGSRAMIMFAPPYSTFRYGLADFERIWQKEGFHRGLLTFSSDDRPFAEIAARYGKTFDLDDEVKDYAVEFAHATFLYGALFDPSDEEQMADMGLRSAGMGEGDGSKADDEDSELKTKSRVLTLDPDGDDRTLMRYLKKRDAIIRRPGVSPIHFVVDRVTLGETDERRLIEALESAYSYGEGRCRILIEGDKTLGPNGELVAADRQNAVFLNDRVWTSVAFSRYLRCEDCGVDFPELTPNLFNFGSLNGACPVCLGHGWWSAFDMDRVFPNKRLTILNGAIAPWNNKTYRSKLKEFDNYASALGVRTNVPFSELTREEINAILNGSPALKYKGLNGFFLSLLQDKYKMHIRVFLDRWQVQGTCPVCQGKRLRKEALAVTVNGANIHDLLSVPIVELIKILDSWTFSETEEQIARHALKQVRSRLECLKDVGLGYLTLERPLKTLSSGENRRVKLTAALGSDLVDMLYVLDEPSNGLHPYDSERLAKSICRLRDRGNTVVVVDHEETILSASDKIVELGPRAGEDGGQVVYEGTVKGIKDSPDSLTGSYLSGRRIGGGLPHRRMAKGPYVTLKGATGYNLKNLDVKFPLNRLCVVTGVSGAGKSALVQETLYPALCSKLGGDEETIANGLPYTGIFGHENLDEVAFVDQTPIGRSPRSNPVTYLKIFDDIRNLYAETPEAKERGYNAGYFSFNVDGGRCSVCKGEGFIQTDMQFTSDVFTRCPQCNGKRYHRSVLEITHRDRNIAEVLDMTAREAFKHFRGENKIQQKLKRMMDVGLDYLRLGQPANTLSGGEAQRLKLASFLSTARKGSCLFIMNEPTAGLHFADVVKLLDCLNTLVDAGNSLIVIEHNPLMMKAADYIIDLGPGAADAGGTVVAEGTPEEVAENKNSITGRYIAKALAKG